MITINESAKGILSVLSSNGYDAYIVGGAVRDAIMGKEPHDWDIATNATPEQVKSLFHTYDSGLKHGTVTAIINKENFEITTFRTESDYSDGRHPDSVKFAKTIEEDLKRRDFTINAMAMDINKNIIDPYNGIIDVENHIIRTVGDPNERFSEDSLRILRALRFSAKLDFNIEEKTKEAMFCNAAQLNNISCERIRDELTKILCTNHPEKLQLLSERHNSKSIADYIFPEFQKMIECDQNNPNHIFDVGRHSLSVAKKVPPDPNIRWAALLHDVGKPFTKGINSGGFDSFLGHPEMSKEISDDILKRLRFSNADRNEILELVALHDTKPSKLTKIRLFAAEHTPIFIQKLNDLQIADVYSQSDFNKEEKIKKINDFYTNVNKVIQDGTAIKKSDLSINGTDLKKLGYSGKQIGEYLDNVYKQCLGSPELNNYDKLIKGAAKNAIKNGFGSDFADLIMSLSEIQLEDKKSESIIETTIDGFEDNDIDICDE